MDWHMVGEKRRAARGAHTGCLDVVFHGDCHAVQNTQPAAFGRRLVAPFGSFKRFVAHHRDHCF